MDYLNLQNQAYECFNLGQYDQALLLYEKCLEIAPDDVINYWYLGLTYLLQGDEEEAQNLWMSVLWQGTPEQTELWTKQLSDLLFSKIQICLKTEDFLTAKKIYQVIVELEQSDEEIELIFQEKANVLLQEAIKSVEYEQGIALYSKVLSLDNTNPQAWYNLSVFYYRNNQDELAEESISQAINLNPTSADYYYTLGVILEKLGKTSAAIQAYEQTISYDTNHYFGNINLGNIYQIFNQLEQATYCYRRAIEINPHNYGAYLNLILIYKRLGYKQEVIELAAQACKLFPEETLFKIKNLLFLPLIYDTAEEIDFYYQRYNTGLDELDKQIKLETQAEKIKALEAIGDHVNFNLSYQGKNHLKLHQKYGAIVAKVMQANYPQWMKPLSINQPLENRKIRLGYVSSLMRNHVGGKLMLGWLENHDRDRFEIYSYYINTILDSYTEQYAKSSDDFQHMPNNLEAICQQIRQDDLDILIFLDVGLFPAMTQLASLRLAPIQCVTWGHPETTGLANVDYFISNELMEPNDSQNHYSEALIKLPHLGVYHSGFSVPQATKNRQDFHESLEGYHTIYICSQILFKYLPQYDDIFPQIAQANPKAKFIFVARPNPYVGNLFRERLAKKFAQHQLDINDYCLFLKELNYEDYWNLYLIADVFLDTISWSGCYTSLEALSCNLPVVTCRGEFMRGHQSVGLLTRINVTETIANNVKEYIAISVKLGLDSDFKKEIKNKIKTNSFILFKDLQCLKGLEEFLSTVVKT